MKKIGILALALVLTLAMAVPAMADITVESYVCEYDEVISCTVNTASIDFGEVTPGVAAASGQGITVENTSHFVADSGNAGSCASDGDEGFPVSTTSITATATVTKLGSAASYGTNLYTNQGLGTKVHNNSITVAAAATETLAGDVCFDVPDGLGAGLYTGTITITCE